MIWLNVPNLTADDVVDITRIEMILSITVNIWTFHGQSDSEDVIKRNVNTSTKSYGKVAPYGADEIHEVMVARKQKNWRPVS